MTDDFITYKKALQTILKKKKVDVEVDTISEHTSSIVTQWVPTGCLALDAIIGGGIPVGRIVEIYGDESTGKSLIAEHIASEALLAGHLVVYADSEAAISLDMLKAIGVDIEHMLYFIPNNMEDVFKTFDAAIDAKPEGKVLILVWDSVAASAAKVEMENDYGKVQVAPQARIMSAALRKMAAKINKHDVSAIMINQTRSKIGVMFGSNVATSGGKALKFYASVRIELSDQGKIFTKEEKKSDRSVQGMKFRAYVVKNKVAKPFRKATIPVLFDHGMDDVTAALEYLKDTKVITTDGAWYTCKELSDKKFQGKDWQVIYDEKFDEITKLIGLS